MQKRQNEITWNRYKAVLQHYIDMSDDAEFEKNIDRATNRGFRMRDGQMQTYVQNKLGLSAYYDKRRVLSDGIHTEPLEFRR
jgi:hypothetical protein